MPQIPSSTVAPLAATGVTVGSVERLIAAGGRRFRAAALELTAQFQEGPAARSPFRRKPGQSALHGTPRLMGGTPDLMQRDPSSHCSDSVASCRHELSPQSAAPDGFQNARGIHILGQPGCGSRRRTACGTAAAAERSGASTLPRCGCTMTGCDAQQEEMVALGALGAYAAYRATRAAQANGGSPSVDVAIGAVEQALRGAVAGRAGAERLLAGAWARSTRRPPRRQGRA
ncbi:unnamed protein product [Prorocentrum cordatum]|uniref:Uncharacterized protein n=1 Tax=Prorocentrum cordatum TaxID=2364126 RepID=A0ABN9STN5_9DINO|nr:unnamed protein product [Polarella glacialis]